LFVTVGLARAAASGTVAASSAVFGRQPLPPSWIRGFAFVAASVLVGPRRVWRLSRYVLTAAHEGGHALVGVATGRRLEGIRLHADASGFTRTSGRAGGAGMVATCLAGYLSPSLLGLVVAWLVADRRVVVVLLLTAALLGGMLLAIRNAFGLLSIAVCIGAVLAVAGWASPTGQSLFASTTAWFLLLGAVRPVWELRRARPARGGPPSDAARLRALTHVPAIVWVGGFAISTVAALAVGARWLIVAG
jgi:hypothetical protein